MVVFCQASGARHESRRSVGLETCQDLFSCGARHSSRLIVSPSRADGSPPANPVRTELRHRTGAQPSHSQSSRLVLSHSVYCNDPSSTSIT
jgi:hypothetical protein